LISTTPIAPPVGSVTEKLEKVNPPQVKSGDDGLPAVTTVSEPIEQGMLEAARVKVKVKAVTTNSNSLVK
jgi:hypothetical protein